MSYQRAETAEDHVGNALQMLKAVDLHAQSPAENEKLILAVEARLMKALQWLRPTVTAFTQRTR